MKKSVFLALAFAAVSLSAHAEDGNIETQPPSNYKPVTVLKKKYVCSERFKAKQYDKDNNVVADMSHNGKNLELVMTVWKNDDAEYHFSEGKVYRDNGQIQNEYRASSKTTRSVVNNQTIERQESTTINNWTGEIVGGPNPGDKLTERKNVSETTYEDLGNGQKRVVKAVVNGKEQQAGAIETEYQLSDDTVIQTTVEAVPYKLDIGDNRLEVSLSETICKIKTIK